MNLRERLLSVLRGGEADRIPWNVYGWITPPSEAREGLCRKGLSLMGTQRIFRPVFEGVMISREERQVDGVPHYTTRIETPRGTLTEESRLETNYGSTWIRKYLISGPEDYAAAEYFFRHTRFEPDFEPWKRADAEMGEGGIVVGEIMPIPIMTLIVSYMGVEGMAEGVYHYPDRFEALLDALDAHYDRHIQLAAESPAEIIWFGDNVTATFISPRLFERYCAPVYTRVMPVMRQAGKTPIAHYDGSNRPLMKALAHTDLPVIEAFTPPPWGDLSVAEAKAAWPDKVVWVNFPGALFLEPADVIYDYALKLIQESAPGGRFVLGCTEDFPLEEFEKTFTAMGQALAAYEGIGW